MGVRETRLRRAVVTGIKLGISSAAVLATAAGWALFGATDQTGQAGQNSVTAQANAAPLVEQAAPQTQPQDIFPRRGPRDDERWRSDLPPAEGQEPSFGSDDDRNQNQVWRGQGDDEREFEGDDDSDENQQQAPVEPPAEPAAPQAIPVPPASGGSQQFTPSQPVQPAPRRPVTRTHSSR